jgi:hypothetical protein
MLFCHTARSALVIDRPAGAASSQCRPLTSRPLSAQTLRISARLAAGMRQASSPKVNGANSSPP